MSPLYYVAVTYSRFGGIEVVPKSRPERGDYRAADLQSRRWTSIDFQH